jgi:outer membrane protein assembly factor BamB
MDESPYASPLCLTNNDLFSSLLYHRKRVEGMACVRNFHGLHLSDGKPLWHITNAWLENLDPALADGLLYIVGSSDAQFPNHAGNHLYALQPANGHQLWDKQLAATISAFLVEG